MADNKAILDYIIASHSPMMSGTIRRMQDKFPHLKGVDSGDIWETATHALMSAVSGHDPAMGSSMSSYAANKIGKALLQRFQPTDVSNTDRSLARRYSSGAGAESQSKQQVGISSGSSVDRGAIESAGGSVSDDGHASGVSVVRNTAAEFGRTLSPEARSELQRKVNVGLERKQAQEPAKETTPAPVQVKQEEPSKPKIIIRRKQIQASLAPEQLDRMNRIDAHKDGK